MLYLRMKIFYLFGLVSEKNLHNKKTIKNNYIRLAGKGQLLCYYT